jgi:hypothetical protein
VTSEQDANVRPDPLRIAAVANPVTPWQNYRYAPDWHADAQKEAQNKKDHNARRREIVFSVSLAESYIVEWVMIEVFDRQFGRLAEIFPKGKKMNVKEKWKTIPKQLMDEGLIPGVPETGDSHGDDWHRLITYRDGLVHASASRPSTAELPENAEGPSPSKPELDALDAGWALGVVEKRIRRLHEAAGTDPPDWLRPAGSSG